MGQNTSVTVDFATSIGKAFSMRAQLSFRCLAWAIPLAGMLTAASAVQAQFPAPSSYSVLYPGKGEILDEIPRGETVLSRPRPDYDPLGVHAGSFIFLPNLEIQETYNSNIFATSTDEKADLISTFVPSMNVNSDWGQHAVNFHADTRVTKHLDNTDEDFIDRTLRLGGRYDIYHDLRVYGAIFDEVRHDERSSPDDIRGVEPTEYEIWGGHGAAEKEFSRLKFRLDGTFKRVRYTDVESSTGATIDQSSRNQNQVDLALRSAYELAPLREVYFLTAYNARDYSSQFDVNGFERDSTGFAGGPGAKYDLTGLIFADVFVGVHHQSYEDRRLGHVTSIIGDGKLIWNITRLTTLTGRLARDFHDTNVAGAAGYFTSVAEIRADHELWRNLLLNARIGYQRDSFQRIDRVDNYRVASAGAKYLIDWHFWVSGGYGFRQRDAEDRPTADFDEHTISARVSAHF